MLLYKAEFPSNTILHIYSISSDEDYYQQHCILNDADLHRLNQIKSNRRLELLAGRVFLADLLNQYGIPPFYDIDEYGKPFLLKSKKFISLSHSNKKVAVILSDVCCGIDIQAYSPKISRIKERFMSETELFSANNSKLPEETYLHIAWCAKESLYKAYGKKSIQFNTQLQLECIDSNKSDFSAAIALNHAYQNYTIHWSLFAYECLALALLKDQ